MVGFSALWMPIVVSAVFVLIALIIIHGMLGWHRGDMIAVPGEGKGHGNAARPQRAGGDYRFPHGNSGDEMNTPEFAEKTKQGPVGVMSIYSLSIAVLAAYITRATFGWLWPQ